MNISIDRSLTHPTQSRKQNNPKFWQRSRQIPSTFSSFFVNSVAAATAQTRPSNSVPMAGLGGFPGGGKTDNSQTATIVVIKQSLGSWSHLWSLSNVSGCGSTSLFGSHAGTHQIRDQSCALEDRNDSNNSLEVYTPNSFIHLFYNSLYMDVVDMHNVIVTPSDSVLIGRVSSFYTPTSE